MKHFGIALSAASQAQINAPIDFVAGLCLKRLLFAVSRGTSSLPPHSSRAFAPLFTAHSFDTGMVLRRGEPHTLQCKVLHSPTTHGSFSPPFRALVLLLLLYRRYGAPTRDSQSRVSYVAVLPVEVGGV
jgi:hypothetical protein